MPTLALWSIKIVSLSAIGIIHIPFYMRFKFIPHPIRLVKGGQQASAIQHALPGIDHSLCRPNQSLNHV